MNGLYQVKDLKDLGRVKDLGFDTVIADHGQEQDIMQKSTLKILVQINPDWDVKGIVKKFNPYQQVTGWILPDEPNMDGHMTPGLMKLTVDKIKKESNKLIFCCIANVNGGRDYADWRGCGADVLLADIYPFKARKNRWYRKAWEEGKLVGKIFKYLYGIVRCWEDSFRMRKAIKAGWSDVMGVLQCFGGKKGSGSDEKFYLPNRTELKRLIKWWRKLGVTSFFSFVWSSNIHHNIKENQWIGKLVCEGG